MMMWFKLFGIVMAIGLGYEFLVVRGVGEDLFNWFVVGVMAGAVIEHNWPSYDPTYKDE